MWNNWKRLVWLFALTALFLLGAVGVSLAQTYRLSAPLPGGSTEVGTFADYTNSLFPFMLSLAAGLAFIMLIIGGLQYIAAAGNPSRISEAKSRIIHAVLGLLLAALSVVILRAINPDLVNLKIDVEPVGRFEDQGGGGGM
ncbi:MAG: hypothetical protein A3C80_04095 [Candidatus Ryanbacteria bacterium RIFCSPHIGHO2_02_FULL_45_43]|nr:MAG: hypothetical protein A2718_00125 [Candidatus Ryanbacteria bacterium RIFCSPHIGHO2_01_FULL_44_130]OGZ48217.1 MAG: hypothetical protein A3C80_04095 [Candidatus Ryanbacteria bacterium RIFCSPHIGHO2_02_FULL_45_43]OGZ49993.1 MAG: hypothetical protein A3E55_01755 [Candidatus Ryanbacteria bacterium RIFCSPHIGHO2_12_FULL_44_20]OGZ51452.1 MAG: hypothetical protein A3A17_01705 [Candidatus Ryanbacteria bacterium RIFCSPLOWO2_01_FULL_44_230]OGZ54487.1 MAG: hypothetical protein A3H62_03705 [Candidatus R